jgi:UDP-N-acetyl-D-glucosamine dehydrogenase
MRVAIVGQGYVGTAIALAAQAAHHDVIGIETSAKRIKELINLTYPVEDNYSKVQFAEIIILAVPTPLLENRKPDLSFIDSACNSLKSFIRPGTLVINESTSFPGTLRKIIAPILGDSNKYAAAPERVDPGNKKWNLFNTPRLVGGLTKLATQEAINFYKSFTQEVIEVSSPEIAEAAKLFENTFRQVNIALANEFAQISNALGISTFETLLAASTKPYGFMKFVPSIGVGGHCIPIDPIYLSFEAAEVGVEAKLINLADQINLNMPKYIASRLNKEFNVKGKSIQFAGIAYKPNISDTRESPAISLIHILRELGAQVTWHDPVVGEWNKENSMPLNICDIAIIATAHEVIDFANWKAQKIVIDISTSSNLGWPKYL